MIIQTGRIALNVEIDETELKKGLTPVIFLHGFTGLSLEWRFIYESLNKKFIPAAVDLIGHGKSDSPIEAELYTAESITEQLNQIFKALHLDNVIICGYSMGARAALSYYANYPQKVSGLILESSTAGIEEIDLRKERIKCDELLIQKIEQEGVEKFVGYWLNMPMFESLKSLPQEEYQNIFDRKKRSNPVGLANSLRSFGIGSMPSLWKIIENINSPVLLITGEYDFKFKGINERMNRLIRHSNHCIVKGCGHNVHLEKPEEFSNLVNRYLSDNIF